MLMHHSVGNEHQSITLYVFSHLMWRRFFNTTKRNIEFPLLVCTEIYLRPIYGLNNLKNMVAKEAQGNVNLYP